MVHAAGVLAELRAVAGKNRITKSMIGAGYADMVAKWVATADWHLADADAFRPYDENDPAFGKALREAKKNGVEVFAYKCNVDREGVAVLDKEVDVLL